MCLILLAHDAVPEFRLVLAANRDELFARPTAPLHRWSGSPAIYAGRDLEAGGTWLGVTRTGRWAAVTNFHEERPSLPNALSRGDLVTGFLESTDSPAEYVRKLLPTIGAYNGFNLLVGDAEEVYWITNRADAHDSDPSPVLRLERGVYGVSNHLIDTPWPKVTRGKEALQRVLDQTRPLEPTPLLDILLDTSYAAEHGPIRSDEDPPLAYFRGSAFVSTPEYGTRSSTALLIGRDGAITIAERQFDAEGRITHANRLEVDS